MRTTPVPLEVRLDDAAIGVDDLCRLAGVELHWVQQRLADGLLTTRASGTAWHFDAPAVQKKKKKKNRKGRRESMMKRVKNRKRGKEKFKHQKTNSIDK